MGGQADKSLADFAPELKCTRETMANNWAEETLMLEYELIGLALLTLFFGALVSGDQSTARR
jgi:hypothetical protein